MKADGDFCFIDTPRPEPWEPMFKTKLQKITFGAAFLVGALVLWAVMG